MTSFAIIAETAPKVNLKLSNNGTFTPLVETNTSSIVAAKRCENYDPSPYATNTWTTSRMSFEWHGDDVASFDSQTHALVSRNSKEATFRPLDQPATRVIMCSSLLESIIARTTYNLASHNGEITFVKGKVHTFRAYTQDDGERVIQEKRGISAWKRFGAITPNGTVTPIIPSHLPKVAADDDPRYVEAAANARKEIRIIEGKANLLNKPAEMMAKGVAVSFKASCRCCNQVLSNPVSVANGIGPTCAKKQRQAAVTTHTTSDEANWSHPQLQEFDLDPSLPLDAEQVLFCTSQLGAMGCSHAEIEQFFDDLLLDSPYWYPNFVEEATKYDKSFDFLHDLCDAFVYSITPVNDYIRIARQLFRYQRDAQGYEFVTCMGSSGGEIVELVAYPHEVDQVKQELVWAG